MSHGTFSGEPRAVWLTEDGPDRRMRVEERFSFTDPDGRLWQADADAVVDGASIPRALWTIVGSPYTGDYRRASIVHDIACDDAHDPAARRAADRMFYHACRAGGCSIAESIVLYLGVRIGAHTGAVAAWREAAQDERRGPGLHRRRSEVRLEADFRRAGKQVLGAGETDDVLEIERRVDAALSEVAGLDLRGR